MTIYFCSPREKPFGCFSNFSLHEFFDSDGRYYRTSEHYYQSHKFTQNPDYRDFVRRAPTPREAALRGRDKRLTIRHDWEAVKDQVMYSGLIFKFTQNPRIRKILFETGDDLLVEKSDRDAYWGCGADGLGKNMLGLTLMRVRSDLLKLV